jgi:hypothetical protein
MVVLIPFYLSRLLLFKKNTSFDGGIVPLGEIRCNPHNGFSSALNWLLATDLEELQLRSNELSGLALPYYSTYS